MLWGIKDNEKIRAKPKESATCPICESELTPKCGVVKDWHWAHKSLNDCDPWAEPESEWHLKWKDNFDKEEQEVIIENHRADIKTKKGLVIEIQNSPICPDDICDREVFYGKMIWVLNGETLGKGFSIKDNEKYFTFSWKNPPQSWFYSEKEIYIDLEKQVKEIKEMSIDNSQRLHMNYDKLKSLMDLDPKEFDFGEYAYSSSKVKQFLTNKDLDITLEDKEEKEKIIQQVYHSWHRASEESRKLRKMGELFNCFTYIPRISSQEKTIFYIKKLYKKVPCGGWGYLMSKKEFLEIVGGKDEHGE